MRAAIVATPALLPDMRPAPGALDGDVMRTRLPLPDTDFRVIDLDPSSDLAEQLDVWLDNKPPDPGSPILFYASSSVAIAFDGELFLCLNPADPTTGDSLRDIAAVLQERAPGSPLLMVLECRHAADPGDPFRSAAVVESAKAAVGFKSNVELLVAARPLTPGDEDKASPFTRAFVEALDAAEQDKGLTAQALFEAVRKSAKLRGVVPSFAHVRAQSAFELVIPGPAGAASPAPSSRTAQPAPPPQPKPAVSPVKEQTPDSGWSAESRPPVERAKEPAAPPKAEEPPVDEDADHEEEHAVEQPAEDEATDAAPEDAHDVEGEEIESVPISVQPESVPPFSTPLSTQPEALNLAFETTGAVNVSFETTGAVNVSFETTGSVHAPAETQVPVNPLFETTGAINPAFEMTQSVNVIFETTGAISLPPTPLEPTFIEALEAGDRLVAEKDFETAIGEYKLALTQLLPDAAMYRAEVHIRIALARLEQDRRRDAISHFEKALKVQPTHRKAAEAKVELLFLERDWRLLLDAEEQLLLLVTDPDERFSLLVAYAERWGGVALDADRARGLLERARDLRPADTGVLDKLRRLYEAVELFDEAIATRRRLAELADEPAEQARQYYELGQYCLNELKREPLAMELFDAALDSDPTFLEPLGIIEQHLEERHDHAEIEHVYQRMIERLELWPKGKARADATWDVSRRLAFLYRDQLKDPGQALDAFESAITARPDDLDSHCFAAEIARSRGDLERALKHQQATARLDPTNMATFHDLFELFQKLRRPDQAYAAACVTVHAKAAEARERFIFEEHKEEGVAKFTRALTASAWEHLRLQDTDPYVEAILGAVAPAAIAAKLAQLDEEKRLPALDPAARQDPQTSTVSIVRSFVWGSHFLGVPAPAVYIRDNAAIGLAAVMALEPSVIIGNLVLRGRSLPELAFLVGRHLAYHVGSHRLLLYYPSLEDLSVVFLAALRTTLKNMVIPPKVRDAVLALSPRMEARLGRPELEKIQRAVAALDATGQSADITRWVSAVEFCAARTGYLLCGDLDVATEVMRAEPLGMVSAADKRAALLGFTVSDAYHALRTELGIAIEP